MGQHAKPTDGSITIAELREFASFPAATQRYIRRSLDVAFRRGDAMETWGRDVVEEASIRAQARIYNRIDEIKHLVPDDSGLDQVEPFMAPLVTISAFDLGQNRLNSFSAYRFLYERLIGAGSRPWLPGAFCAAALEAITPSPPPPPTRIRCSISSQRTIMSRARASTKRGRSHGAN